MSEVKRGRKEEGEEERRRGREVRSVIFGVAQSDVTIYFFFFKQKTAYEIHR